MDFLLWLQQRRTPLGEKLFECVTYFGADTMIFLVICVILWCVSRKAAVRTVVIFASSAMINQVCKLVFAVPRPWVRDVRILPVESSMEGASGYSLPSGHTQCAVSVYGSLALYFRKNWLYVLSLVVIALVMFSRMYLGVHTPTDVFVSFAIAAVVTFVLNRAMSFWENNPKFFLQLFIVSVVMAALIISYCLYLLLNGTPVAMLNDAMLGAGGISGFFAGLFLDSRKPELQLSRKWKLIQCIIGLIILILIKEGLKAVLLNLPGNIWKDCARYCLLGIFISWGNPLLVRRLNRGRWKCY